MKVVILVCLGFGIVAALVGCSGPTITSEQQQTKRAAMHNVAKKMEGPNWVDRGR